MVPIDNICAETSAYKYRIFMLCYACCVCVRSLAKAPPLVAPFHATHLHDRSNLVWVRLLCFSNVTILLHNTQRLINIAHLTYTKYTEIWSLPLVPKMWLITEEAAAAAIAATTRRLSNAVVPPTGQKKGFPCRTVSSVSISPRLDNTQNQN